MRKTPTWKLNSPFQIFEMQLCLFFVLYVSTQSYQPYEIVVYKTMILVDNVVIRLHV